MAIEFTRKNKTDGGDASPAGQAYLSKTDTLYFDVTHPADTTTDEILAQADVLGYAVKSPHPDGNQFMRVATRRRAGGRFLSELAVEYEAPRLDVPTQGNPVGTPPKIRYRTQKNSEGIDTDVNGDPIIMVTGEEFDPRPQEVRPLPIMDITKSVNFDPGDVIEQYTWATNSDTFRGRPAGSLLMWDMEAEDVTTEDFYYWVLHCQIAYKSPAPGSTPERAWYLRLLAQGYRVKVTLFGATKTGPATDERGNRSTKPVLHDTTSGAVIRDNASAQWYEFETKNSLPFNSIGLLI
jgi:hypothetical protein